MKKLLLLIIPLILVITVVGVPVYYDISLGDESLPDSSLYGLELIGENIKCTLTSDRKACLLEVADEKAQEANELKDKLNTIYDQDEINRYKFMILQVENMANRLRLEALR